MKLIIGTFVLFAIFYISCLDWRRSIKTVFFLVVFEGVLRKWILPQASDSIYFLKDIVLLGAYTRYYFLSPKEQKIPLVNDWLKISLFFITGWCLFQAFNPSLGSPIIGIFGLRGYIFYMPLMWILPSLFSSEEDLYQFLRSHLLLLIPVGLLGIFQFFLPNSFLNVYAGGIDSVASFRETDYVRITGTFSYISGYSTYLGVCFALLIPVFIKELCFKWQIALSTAMILLISNSFMTGSRSVVLSNLLIFIGYFAILFWQQPSLARNYTRRFLIPGILSLLTIAWVLRPAFDAFMNRATSSDNLGDRITNTFVIDRYLQYKFLDGYGTGATHQAIQSLRSVLSLPRGETIPIGFESEIGRIALELGLIGFLFWYALRVSLIITLWFTFWRLKKPFLKQLALAAFLLHLINLPSQLIFNHTFSVYYWFLAGFIFLLPRLEYIENYYQQQRNKNVLSSPSHGSRYS